MLATQLPNMKMGEALPCLPPRGLPRTAGWTASGDVMGQHFSELALNQGPRARGGEVALGATYLLPLPPLSSPW